MKYLEKIYKKNKVKIFFIILGFLIVIFYLYFKYKYFYISSYGYIENLDNCTTLDCSTIKTTNGTVLKNDNTCVNNDPDCIPSNKCRICKADSTNPICTGSNSSCTKDGNDPYSSGQHVGCCSGSTEFLKTWDNNNRNYYKCCTPEPSDLCTDVHCAADQTCQAGICVPSGGGGDPCVSITCQTGETCQAGICVPSGGGGGSNSIDIKKQPDISLQIVNNTSENPLHVFLGTINDAWVKLDGNGTVYPAVAWGSKPELIAWDPVGAGNLSEVIIPNNGYMILKLPQDTNKKAFRVTPLKLTNNDNTPLTSTKMASSKVLHQWPILLEGGQDVVADSSAVDGINFKMKYELTSDNGSVKVMEIHKNPCEGLDKKYQMDVGCLSPAKIDCDGAPTCECKDETQDCMFNNCSKKLFNIPPNLKQYIGKYDGGEPNDVVKKFINKSKNINDGSPLRQYCDNLQSKDGDFTAYCYDYNDVSSSPLLRTPYKMKVTYTDL